MRIILLLVLLCFNALVFAQQRKKVKKAFVTYLKEHLDQDYLKICERNNTVYLKIEKMPCNFYALRREFYDALKGELPKISYDTFPYEYCFFIQVNFKQKCYSLEQSNKNRWRQYLKKAKNNPKVYQDNRMFFYDQYSNIEVLDNYREGYLGFYKISDKKVIKEICNAVYTINVFFKEPLELEQWRLAKLEY